VESKGGRDVAGRKLGEFVLREQIGEGGYGAVHRGEQPLLKRDVVVKVLHERRQRDDIAQARFMREAQMASQLDHPYAAHIYAFGIEPDDGLRWIAMELVHGVTLDEWLRDRGPLTLEEFVPFFECVADVVQAAHERGIVHRDLKPANIMVIERRGRMTPKLLDFGIAKLSGEAVLDLQEGSPDAPAHENGEHADGSRPDSGVTRTDPAAKAARLTPHGAGMGSSAYMSPEQWDSARDVGPASDIYALGVLAYESLTGRVPFGAASEYEYHRLRENEQVPPIGGDLSSDLDRVFRRALASSPDARYSSALDLASELRSVLRASERELLRTSAQQWDDKSRAPGLLWGGDVLAELDRWRRRAPAGALSALECSFVAASHRRARRFAWYRRLGAGLAVAVVVGAFQYRAAMQTRLAQGVTDATITRAELEQGRAALLHSEPEAALHLGKAYDRGDHSASTAFMLARALQPQMSEQARFSSSFGRMWSATFSPDGRQVVTTDDQEAVVWDARTYQPLVRLPHGSEVYQAVYSSDGTRLVTAAQDAIRVWQVHSGSLVRELKQRRTDGKPEDYYIAAVSPDGRSISAIDAAGSLTHVWDLATGALLAELPSQSMEYPGVAYSSDGLWLATSGGDDVRIFNTSTWDLAITIPGPNIRRFAFDPTGPRLIAGSFTGDVSVWAVPGGVRIRHLRELGEPVDAVAFSPDGRLVATAGRSGTEQIWRVASGALDSQFTASRGKIRAVEFDRTSKLVLAAGYDGTVVVVDVALGTPVTTLEGAQNVIASAHFDPSSRRIIGASWDGTARVWDATPAYRRWTTSPKPGECGLVTSAEQDRRFIAVGCKEQPTRVWDTARDELLAELPAVTRVDGDFASAFPAVSAAGDRAAIARGNTVEVYELPGGRLIHTITHHAQVNVVRFAANGRDIVSGGIDGSLLVSRANGAVLVLPTAAGGIDAAELLDDGRIIATDARRRLRIYDREGRVLVDRPVPCRVMSLRFEGLRAVAIPLFTEKVAPPLLLDVENYRLVSPLAGHVGRVYSARWVAGGRILTAGGDGTARLWNGSTGQLLRTYRGSSRFLSDAILSPGELVIASGADGILRFWDTSTEQQLWTLSAHKSPVVGLHLEGADIVTRELTGEISRWTLPPAAQVIEACWQRKRCVIVPR